MQYAGCIEKHGMENLTKEAPKTQMVLEISVKKIYP
jgi:hypothetical protein